MIRTAIGLFTTLLLSFPAYAEDIAPEDLEVFFELIAVGPVTAVRAALTETAALATAPDAYGFQAIHMLDYNGFDEKLRLLLANGASVDARTEDGHGLLHMLIDPEFLPTVLAAGADINLTDAGGRTPLMLFAQEREGEDMTRALIAAGADVSLRDTQGHGVLYYAVQSGQADNLVQDLIAAGAPTD